MNHDFAAAMRRATELVRAGHPAAATDIIQASLAGAGNTDHTVPAGLPAADFRMPGPASRRRGLAATLADMAKSVPQARTGPVGAEPSLPDGASFHSGTFSCAAGQREYRVYVPDLAAAKPAGLVMMLHGCTQSPVDFANGTGMNRQADKHRLIVVYPAQARGANMQSCWNWFAPGDQNRGAGEPAILAGLVDQLWREHGLAQQRVFAAGLSAGAAMAVILGHAYPDVFAAIGAHSGLPYRSAHDVPSAFAVMNGAAAAPARPATRSTPTIVFHGSADATVNAANGQRIADDAHPGGAELLDDGATNGRRYTRRTALSPDGHSVMEHWSVAGLGHAWSGGDTAGSYTDPSGPDASAEMARFFVDLPVKAG